MQHWLCLSFEMPHKTQNQSYTKNFYWNWHEENSRGIIRTDNFQFSPWPSSPTGIPIPITAIWWFLSSPWALLAVFLHQVSILENHSSPQWSNLKRHFHNAGKRIWINHKLKVRRVIRFWPFFHFFWVFLDKLPFSPQLCFALFSRTL